MAGMSDTSFSETGNLTIIITIELKNTFLNFRVKCSQNTKMDLKFEMPIEVPSPSVSPKNGGKIQTINTQNKWAYIVCKSSLAVSPHY